MLIPANGGHLDLLKNWIKAGAEEHSFDSALASDSAESALFFANLRQALVLGSFVQEDCQGKLTVHHASGYLYSPEVHSATFQPIGFGLFKALPDFGFELWLTGVDRAWRGHGHGHAMLSSMLATPVGHLAYVARVDLASASCPVMQHVLESLNFNAIRDTSDCRWYVRADAPASVTAFVRLAPSVRPDVH